MTKRHEGFHAGPILDQQRVGESGQEFAARCGVPHRTIQRWENGTRLKAVTADRVAIALGHHPVQIWGEEWFKCCA